MATLQEPELDLEAGGGDDGGGEESVNTTMEIAGLVPQEMVEKGSSDGEGSKRDMLKVEKDCRICHMSLGVNSEESESGIAIELGCCCKDDLAGAHKHCAEAWFKIKGDRTCEICGSIARNIVGADEAEVIDQWNEPNGTSSRAAVPSQTMDTLGTRNFWQGHRFLNFLLASMVFAFVISWLFHFNIPS